MLSTEDGLRRVTELASTENWLAVLVTTRGDGQPAVSVVNAGILPHPTTGTPVVGLVSVGNTAKLRNLRATPSATLVFRAGWQWVAVTGPAELAGPDDPHSYPLPRLLRDIYHAAGGSHPDLDEYDRQMVADRRAAVLITPTRFTTNPG
jgi:PPOX class probable F420-dependent enzyme